MRPPPFVYVRVDTRSQVDQALADHPGALLLAGGQSLVPQLNERTVHPSALIDLNFLLGEDAEPTRGADAVKIGPLVRQAALEHSPLVARTSPLLATAIRKVAYPAVRSRGTLVGALAYAHPQSELPATFALLGGTAAVRGPGGPRLVAAEELFVGPCRTSLAQGEWIEGVSIPAADPTAGFGLAEFTRRSADFALCGAVAAADRGTIRLAWFGRDSSPRVHVLPGAATDPLADRVADLVAATPHLADATEDDADYFRHLARAMAMTAIRQALKGTGLPHDPS